MGGTTSKEKEDDTAPMDVDEKERELNKKADELKETEVKLEKEKEKLEKEKICIVEVRSQFNKNKCEMRRSVVDGKDQWLRREVRALKRRLEELERNDEERYEREKRAKGEKDKRRRIELEIKERVRIGERS